MTTGRACKAALLAAALLCLAAAPVPPELAVRSGEHPGFGRVVFDLPHGIAARATSIPAAIVLRFSAPVRLSDADGLPRNVRSLTADGASAAVIALAPGAQPRIMRLAGRLVIDVRDPPRTPPPHRDEPPATIEPILPALARMPPPQPAAPQVEALLPALARMPPPPAPPAATPPPSILLPLPQGVGAASLVRAGRVLLVFDRPERLAPPAAGVLAGAAAEVLPDATVLSVPAPARAVLVLSREPAGWRVTAAPSPAAPAAPVDRRAGAVLIHSLHPGRTVAVPDPASGGVLLVGTETAASGRIDQGWETPFFAALPTTLGVAVAPYSDRVQLAETPEGFRIGAEIGALALAAGPLPGSLAQREAALTRTFQFGDASVATLRARLLRERQQAAQAPPLARAEPRLAVARTLLSLGMEDDALGVLAAAASADPSVLHDPRYVFLNGAAEVLAGRPGQAAGLASPHLPATDDVALWRALRDAEAGADETAAAAVLARTAPMLLSYPDAIRRLLLPLAAETMIDAGQAEAAGDLLAARPDDPVLALARAMHAEAAGDTAQALAQYDALTDGRDRLVRIRAAMRAIDLRVAHRMLAPGAAADALARLDPAWRGDRIELARREREAALRAEAGDPDAALAALHAALARFPEAASDLRKRMQNVLSRALAAGATHTMPPAALTAMLAANLDVFADALAQAAPDTHRRVVADLLSGDLPPEAEPILARLIDGAPPGADRAALGARLAELRLAAGEDKRASHALASTEADGLPADLAARRAVIAARLQARTGDVKGAIAALSGIGTGEAERAEADLAEAAGDYPAAAAALLAESERSVPVEGPLDAHAQALILRLATDAARGNATAALDEIRTRWLPRLPQTEAGNTIRLLLAPPINRLADLPRAAQEAKLAADVAAGLLKPTK